MYIPPAHGAGVNVRDVDRLLESKHQQQSMAFVGRLLLIVIPDLFQVDIAASNIPTLNVFAASGISGIVSLPQPDSQQTLEALRGLLQMRFPGHHSRPEQISRWSALLGYDGESTRDAEIANWRFYDRTDGMRTFVVAAEPAVKEFGHLLEIDVLDSQPLVEVMIRTALKAITDPDAKYDCGLVFLRSVLGSHPAAQGRASPTRREGEKHARQMEVLEEIDRVLGDVLIPGLLESAELHCIEYAIAITGDPHPTDFADQKAQHAPLTITTLGAVKSALEMAAEEAASRKVTGEGRGRRFSRSASELQQEHRRRRRDSLPSFSFPESSWDLCGLGRLARQDVWTALRRFLAHEVLVCDNDAADGEEGDEAVLAVADEEAVLPDEFADDAESLK